MRRPKAQTQGAGPACARPKAQTQGACEAHGTSTTHETNFSFFRSPVARLASDLLITKNGLELSDPLASTSLCWDYRRGLRPSFESIPSLPLTPPPPSAAGMAQPSLPPLSSQHYSPSPHSARVAS